MRPRRLPSELLGLWLYGTLVLRGRLSGYILQLLLSILGLGVVIIHLKGAHMGQIAVSSGGVVFVWTLFVLEGWASEVLDA